MNDITKFWPKAVAHLQEKYDDGVSDHVIIAENNKEPCNGYKGLRIISTALIPLALVDEVLSSPGGIGYQVKSWGPRPCVNKDEIYDTSFWIDGRKGCDERFQTIVNAWKYHTHNVMLPDNVMLMTYGLVPRYLNDGSVCWDDPSGPVYDVLFVKSHVNIGDQKGDSLGFIKMRRDYLEDYCHLKGCAAVAVYYEERFSADDETFAPMLNGEKGKLLKLPGRELSMSVLNDGYFADAPQFSRVWGVRLILKPNHRPITDAQEPELIWPGHTESMCYEHAAQEWIYGYVRDEVLLEYESRSEYKILPEFGGVSYGGWWGTDRTFRIGRHHIKVELKKLYEGCPPHVITHWHRFAVTEEIAQHDSELHGNRSIAHRAKDVIYAYLALLKSLEKFSDQIGVSQTQEEIGSLNSDDVTYRGWWSHEVSRQLYAVAPLTSSRDQFLTRSVALFKLIELLKPGPLRVMALRIGVPKDKIREFKSLKLLSCLYQLANLAKGQGYALLDKDDANIIVSQWDPTKELPELISLFALNGLRDCQSHTPSKKRDQMIADAAKKFGIDVNATTSGWGYAIDSLYDRLSEDLLAISCLISEIR
jgi:hypothetical protein